SRLTEQLPQHRAARPHLPLFLLKPELRQGLQAEDENGEHDDHDADDGDDPSSAGGLRVLEQHPEAPLQVIVENGAKVVFCARGGAAGEALEAELNKTGPGSCKFVTCDISKEDDIKRLIDVTVARHGHVDCLVNNAGWHPPHKPTDDVTAQEFRDLLNLNVVSYFLASKYALPYLRQRHGNIINVSSLVATIGQKHAAPYVATKGAIISMTKAMAVDESVHNVRVNCISPGNVLTPLWEELAGQTPDAAAAIKTGETHQLLGRMGTEGESGLAALYLAADATFCTGIDLLLSGGAELNYGIKSQIPS
uniref:Hydroxysteroid (17-beta) dehydrogenase 14 n=1 Tax=Gasterosteus aculeatus aculeatus TaxID=481459 RepID=A0AAQ4QHA7_GASAC